MSDYEELLLYFFDKDGDGVLNDAEQKQRVYIEGLIDLSEADYSHIDAEDRSISEELFSANIVEKNRIGYLESQALVKKIPLEIRPVVF